MTTPNPQLIPQVIPPVVPDANAPKGEDGESVSMDAYTSVKNDMHKYKEAAQKSADALKKLEDEKLQKNEQWKEYAAAKEKEANDYKQKYELVNSSILERSKLSKVKEECAKLGLIDAAYEDLEALDFKDVIVETTSTGRVNVMGAKSAAERLKSLKPHWFSDTRVPNVNGKVPDVRNTPPGSVTAAEIVKLEAEAKKTGDFTEYRKKLVEYKMQKK